MMPPSVLFGPESAIVPQDAIPRYSSRAVARLALLAQMEREAGLESLRKHRRQRKRREFLSRLVRLWPVALGVALAFYAPLLRSVADAYQPWGMRLIFPFVLLAGRPETHLGGTVTGLLQQGILYAQFPLEGLLATRVLRSRVTFGGVAGQLFLFHLLGAVDIWLVSGVMNQFSMR